MNRRSMMKKTAESAAAILIANAAGAPSALLGQNVPQGRVYDPRRYGAAGDGVTMDTRALQAAIDACTLSGGGTVSLGPGTYLSGTINLKSNVTFQLQAGAKLLGSPNASDYVLPPEGVKALNYGQYPGKHLIFAIGAQNVSLVGPGVVDGNGPSFFVQVNHTPVRQEDAYKDIAAFYTKRTTGISPMVQFANCTNLRVENITLQNTAGWTLHPVGCSQVVIRKVTVRNPINASNTDGIDPSSSQDVLITDCDIITGDDGICVKSYNPYGKTQLCRNIKVVNCRVTSCTNALRVGVEGPNPFQNISFTDCEVYAVNGPLNTSPAAGICVIMEDGTSMDGVSFNNIKITGARTPIYVRLQTATKAMNLKQTQGTPLTGSMQNISFAGIQATGAIFTSSITGIGDLHIKNVSLTDINIQTAEPGQLAWTQLPVKEAETIGAGPYAFGRLPCYGLYLRHIDGLTMRNVNIQSKVGDPRPMLTCDDITQATLQNVNGTPSDPSQPFLDLRNMKGTTVTGNRAPAGAGVYAKVSGTDTHGVQFQGNDFTQSQSPVMRTPEVPQDGVRSIN